LRRRKAQWQSRLRRSVGRGFAPRLWNLAKAREHLEGCGIITTPRPELTVIQGGRTEEAGTPRASLTIVGDS
jgi:hypothetical protein